MIAIYVLNVRSSKYFCSDKKPAEEINNIPGELK